MKETVAGDRWGDWGPAFADRTFWYCIGFLVGLVIIAGACLVVVAR